LTQASQRIAAVVVTRDRPELFGRLVLPGLHELARGGFPVVVVDQGEDVETERLVRAASGFVYLTSPPGLSRGRNTAVEATSTELLAFADDDVVLPSGWLQLIVDAFDGHSDAGAVCGRGVTPAGRLLPGRDAGVYRFPTNPFGLGSGFNLAFRRAALEAAGPFDEELGAGSRFHAGEDTDLLYRVMRAGWCVVCSDEITVVHDDWRSGAAELRVHFRYGFGAGAQTAAHLAAGDRAAFRIGLQEAWKHVRTFAMSVLTFRVRIARLQVAFLVGLVAGFAQRRRLAGRARPGEDQAVIRR